MKLWMTTVAIAALAMPALGQDAPDYATMTCADLAALDEPGMASAMDGLMAAAGEGMASDTMDGDAPDNELQAGADVFASIDEEMEPEAGEETAAAESEDGWAAAAPTGPALAETGAADPSMLAMDAMMQVQGAAGDASGDGPAGADCSDPNVSRGWGGNLRHPGRGCDAMLQCPSLAFPWSLADSIVTGRGGGGLVTIRGSRQHAPASAMLARLAPIAAHAQDATPALATVIAHLSSASPIDAAAGTAAAEWAGALRSG